MNFVFWLAIIIFAVALWFILNPLFRLIGEVILSIFNSTKKQLNNDKESEDFLE